MVGVKQSLRDGRNRVVRRKAVREEFKIMLKSRKEDERV